jgi:hypothetical protein
MTKLKFFGSLLVIFSFSLFISCSKEDEKTPAAFNENSIAKSLVFKKLELPKNSSFSRFVYSGPNASRLSIVSWDEWGHASSDCRGWGLCNATWFEWESDKENPVYPNTNGNGYATPLQIDDSTGTYYLEVLLAAETDIPENLLDLKIDADFELDTALQLGKNLVFKQGTYNFDPSLGEFGGIRIDLH